MHSTQSNRQSWVKPVLVRLRLSYTSPSTHLPTRGPKSSPELNFDCLYLIFSALCDLTRGSGLQPADDVRRGYLCDRDEWDPVRRELSAASRVCRAWKLPAQLCMLHTTKISRSSQAQALINFLSRHHATGNFLQNSVQALELGRSIHPQPQSYNPRSSDANLSRWQVFELLRLCHRVRSLSLLQWRPDLLATVLDDPKSAFLPPISFDVLRRHAPFEQLTTLRLYQYSGTFAPLLEIMFLTPALTCFVFEGCITDGAEIIRKGTTHLPDPPFQLQRLSVAGYDNGFLVGFEWILRRSWRTLKRLDLGYLLPSVAGLDPSLLLGLQHLSTTHQCRITELSLTMMATDIPTFIKCCPNLRSLRIDGTHSVPPPSQTSLATTFAHFPPFSLHQCLIALHTPSKLESLELVFLGGSSGKRGIGISPSIREISILVRDLQILEALMPLVHILPSSKHLSSVGRAVRRSHTPSAPQRRGLMYLTLSFNLTTHSYPDAPLDQLRQLREVCISRGIRLSMPDLYDIVLGYSPRKGGSMDEGRVGFGEGTGSNVGRSRTMMRMRGHGRFFSVHGV